MVFRGFICKTENEFAFCEFHFANEYDVLANLRIFIGMSIAPLFVETCKGMRRETLI